MTQHSARKMCKALELTILVDIYITAALLFRPTTKGVVLKQFGHNGCVSEYDLNRDVGNVNAAHFVLALLVQRTKC